VQNSSGARNVSNQLEIKQLRQDVSKLSEKTDEVIESLAYLSDEYDDYTEKISTTTKMAKVNLEDIATLKTKFDDHKQQHQVTLNQIDDLEQYGRREGNSWYTHYEKWKYKPNS